MRRRFLRGKVCAACGGRRKLEAHHVKPFHLDRGRELDEANLIPLCEGNHAINCHLVWGHRGNFRSWNPTVRDDVAVWRAKVRTRP